MKKATAIAIVALVRFFSITLVPLNVSPMPPPKIPDTPPLPEWSSTITTRTTARTVCIPNVM